MTRTHLLLVRHLSHERNKLSMDSLRLGFSIGKNLRKLLEELGIPLPSFAQTSPQPRAVETLLIILHGMDNMIPIFSDVGLGDLLLGEYPFSQEDLTELTERVATNNSTPEEVLLSDPFFKEVLNLRGLEGAHAILNTIRRHPGETILQCSHGGSRIEATLAKLQGYPDVQE